MQLLKLTKKTSFYYQKAFALACTTACLFLLHPVQTQTVSYVIQGQLEGLAGLFIMAIALCFIIMTTTKNKLLSYILGAIICILGYVSCGTKEIAIMSPIMLLLIDWFFIAQGDLKKIKKRIPFYLIFSGIIIAQYIYILKPQFLKHHLIGDMQLNNNVGNVITQLPNQKITRWNYFISQFKVIVHYMWIFIWPWNMSVDYDWKMVPDFFSTECILPLLLLLFIGFLIITLLRKNKIDVRAFAALWFFIGLSPRSTFIPSTELLADYKTYFSSFGIFLLLSMLLVYSIQVILKKISVANSVKKSILCGAIIIGIASLSYATSIRNTIWRSQEEFWLDIIKHSPLRARAYNNYAVSLAEQKRHEEAIPYFRKAIKMDAFYPDPWSNIAVCFNAIQQVDMAIMQLEKAIKINPHYPEFYNNLASFYLTKKEYPRVEQLAQHAIKLRPHYGKAFFNWGQALYEQGKKEEGFEKLRIACLKADFDTVEAFTTYAHVALELQKFDEAVIGFQNICALQPQNPDNHFNLANAYYCTKQYDKSQQIYKMLIAQNPQEYRSWFNLAETHIELGQIAEATECFKMAQPLAHQAPQLATRIAQFIGNGQVQNDQKIA